MKNSAFEKNKERWLQKESSALNGDSLKNLSCALPQNNGEASP